MQISSFTTSVSSFAQANAIKNRGTVKNGDASQIQSKADRTVKNALTDEFVERLTTLAKEDAQRGVYMDSEAIRLQNSQLEKYVSPDRSGPMAQANQAIQKAARSEDENILLKFLERMLGRGAAKVRKDSRKQTFLFMNQMSGGCSGNVHSNSGGQTAEIYSPDGEKIASYNSNGGGWTIEETQAEGKFRDESVRLYKQAYDAARAEIKAQRTAVDFRA